MKTKNKSSESGRFEAGLHALLHSCYQPLKPRKEFSNELFEKMRSRYTELCNKRKQKRKQKILCYITSGLAASLLLGFSIIYLKSDLQKTITAKPPHLQAATANFHNWSGKIEGKVDLGSDGKNWQRIEKVVYQKQPLRLRTTSNQAGIEIAPGTSLVMNKGSKVSLSNNQLDIAQGLLSLRILENAKPLQINIKGHQLKLQPGSWLGVEVKPDDKYAPGGSPPPDITLLKGKAKLSNFQGSCPLVAGRSYHLHNYLHLKTLGGEELDSKALTNNNAWIKPNLVNFQTKRYK